ncbi:MAG TPA: hypothetical protein VJA94_20085 [Candidatus Angelobacter sp.]
MDARTTISFPINGEIWSRLDQWAAAFGYSPRPFPGPGRLYQKGTGFLVAPMMLSVRQENSTVALEAWVRFNFFTRLTSLFILPAEIGVQSGGFKAVLPRKMARDAINVLLNQLGVPMIP